ncbi:putative ATPase [Kribbella sp. VKM Ac-2571]|uniref:ATP-binding protein n=1 Tax=Kribbella sp. VKM Ac-2571 TaxID=2512222 RepID=UPI00105EE3ED|nr:helix-turn-helix domain-containing protein [Kribbella sp. VKM Ac-2571]TDO69020.1 putative ATPase [Kribbella sp. VKM Ac-2571]
MADLAAALRRFRSLAELTQEELAERAGISVRAVSDIERGARRRIYPATARQLAAALGLEAADRSTFERVARGLSPVVSPTDTGRDLPAPRTALFGRQRELAELGELLAGNPPLLITVTGPGGVGKTRLALEATRARASRLSEVHWVQLGQLGDHTLVLHEIARSVGATAIAADVLGGLARAIGVRPYLLVLDTFEHLLPAAPGLSDLLSRCPGLTLLVTTRARLRLNGEREFTLGPLPLAADASTMAAAEELFVDRAHAANRHVAVDASLVADVCRRLDGVPLAIELAAARTRHLSLTDLARQLESGSRVLARGPQDLPRRQESMQATVAWSYDLLEPAAQVLMRRLSVFAGWTLEAADAVCGKDSLELLSTLLDHNLVTASPHEICGTRYQMLDVVREYAAHEAAVHAETTMLQARHADYFLRLVQDLEPLLRTRGQSAAHLRLDADLSNLRSAHRRLLATDPSRALALAGSLWMFWLWRGGMPEGLRWVTEALDADDGSEPQYRAKALWGAGWLAFHQGHVEQTAIYVEELLRLAERTGEAVHRRNALTLRGMTEMAAGATEAARSSFRTAQETLRGTDEPWLIATSALNLGLAELHAGDVAAAEHHFVDAARQYAEMGDETYLSRANRHLAAAALLNGQLERAEQLFAAELVQNGTGTEWGAAESLEGLSWVAAVRGDAERTAELAHDAACLRARLGVQLHPFDALLARRFRGA